MFEHYALSAYALTCSLLKDAQKDLDNEFRDALRGREQKVRSSKSASGGSPRTPRAPGPFPVSSLLLVLVLVLLRLLLPAPYSLLPTPYSLLPTPTSNSYFLSPTRLPFEPSSQARDQPPPLPRLDPWLSEGARHAQLGHRSVCARCLQRGTPDHA